MHNETGFNYTCRFPQELCLTQDTTHTCAERLCLLGNLKIIISYYLNVNFPSLASIILK